MIKHGMHGTPEYHAWEAMIQRCTNSKHPEYFRYGGRGISICKQWMNFQNFFSDMGFRPVGKTLDRYPDNDGNYKPENCRWATPFEQTKNRRKQILCKRGHLLGGENIYKNNLAGRSCIVCAKMRSRKQRENKRAQKLKGGTEYGL